jgi:hypothetical protein
MWLLLEGWLLRHVLTMLGWLAGATTVAAVLFGAREAGRNAERVENMRRTIDVQRDQLEAASRRPRDRGELAIDSAAAFSARKVLQALLNVDIDDSGSVEAFHNRRRATPICTG